MACPHGEHESYCIECLDGPPAKVAPNRLDGVAVSTATFMGVCARKACNIVLGDTIIYVNDHGWCCLDCAAPPPTMSPTKGRS